MFDKGKMHELFSWNSHSSSYGYILVYNCTKVNGYELVCRWACKLKQLASNFNGQHKGILVGIHGRVRIINETAAGIFVTEINAFTSILILTHVVRVYIEVLLQSKGDIDLIEKPAETQPQVGQLYGLPSRGRTFCTQHIICLFVRFFGTIAVHKYSGITLSDIKPRIRALYMENLISKGQVNDRFIETGGVFSVGSWQVMGTISTTILHYKLVNHTLDNICRRLPCRSQLLGILLRHKWHSKELIFFDGQAKVEGRTGLRPQHSIQFPLELTKSHPLSLMRVVLRHLAN